MRRLPIYLLIDTSASMTGEPIAAVENGIEMLLTDLRDNPQALETAWLSVITFGGEAKQVVPLTSITEFKCPELIAGGKNQFGSALKLVCDCREREIVEKMHRNKNGTMKPRDWAPEVFIFSDEITNSREVEDGIRSFKSVKWAGVAAVAAKDCADDTILKRIADQDQFYHVNDLGQCTLIWSAISQIMDRARHN